MPISEYMLEHNRQGAGGVSIVDILRALGRAATKPVSTVPAHLSPQGPAQAVQPQGEPATQPPGRATQGAPPPAPPAPPTPPKPPTETKEESISRIMKDIEKLGGTLTAAEVFNKERFDEQRARQLRDAMLEMRGQAVGRAEAIPEPKEPTAPAKPGIVKGILNTLSKPEVRSALGDIAVAFSHPTVNADTGAVLSTPWQARLGNLVRNRANDELFARALRGGDASTLPAEMQEKAALQRTREGQLDVERRRLELEELKRQDAKAYQDILGEYYQAMTLKLKDEIDSPKPPKDYVVLEGDNEVTYRFDMQTGEMKRVGTAKRDAVLRAEAAGAQAAKPLSYPDMRTIHQSAKEILSGAFIPLLDKGLLKELQDPSTGVINHDRLYGELKQYPGAQERYAALMDTYLDLVTRKGVPMPDALELVRKAAQNPVFLALRPSMAIPVTSVEEYEQWPVGTHYTDVSGDVRKKAQEGEDPIVQKKGK